MYTDPSGKKIKQGAISGGQFAGAASYQFLDNQTFGHLDSFLREHGGAPRCNTDACLSGQAAGDKISTYLDLAAIHVGITMSAGGAGISTGGWTLCPVTEGVGCAAGIAGAGISAGGVAVGGYGGANLMYVKTKGDNPQTKQDKQLSEGEIKKLQKGGIDIHEIKPNAKFDLFKDAKGDIYYKRKTGRGTSEPEYVGHNINDF